MAHETQQQHADHAIIIIIIISFIITDKISLP